MSATSSFVAISASASTSTVKPPLAKSHTTIHDSRHAKQSRPQAPALPSHPQTSHGTRSKLIDLLPISRHALFHARVTIHQLWNVPLVHGSFGVKWKFQGVHSATSAKLKLQEAMDSLKGKEKDVLDALDEHHQHPSSTRSIYTSGSSNLSAPSLSAPSLGSSSSNSSNNKPSLPPSPNSKERCIIDFKSESRGRTEFVKLQDHNVKWGHSVDVAVQMSINRETQELQPSELKLVVMQVSRCFVIRLVFFFFSLFPLLVPFPPFCRSVVLVPNVFKSGKFHSKPDKPISFIITPNGLHKTTARLPHSVLFPFSNRGAVQLKKKSNVLRRTTKI